MRPVGFFPPCMMWLTIFNCAHTADIQPCHSEKKKHVRTGSSRKWNKSAVSGEADEPCVMALHNFRHLIHIFSLRPQQVLLLVVKVGIFGIFDQVVLVLVMMCPFSRWVSNIRFKNTIFNGRFEQNPAHLVIQLIEELFKTCDRWCSVL